MNSNYSATYVIRQYLIVGAGDNTAALTVNHTHRCTAGFHATALTDCVKYSTTHNALDSSYFTEGLLRRLGIHFETEIYL